ncbi:MAG: hypothetical protein GY797_34800 [Deltaproteobacteria bacterium]|nr:hypothetical protein [Deltaproteobacteria bacterium]
MKEYFGPYLKLFFTTFLFSLPVGIPVACYFLMMGMIFWLSFTSKESFEAILPYLSQINQSLVIVALFGCLLTPSIIMGGMMSLSIGSLHIVSAKKVQTEKTEGILNIHQTRSIQLEYPYRKAFELCTLSLKTIDNCKIQRTDRNKGTIEAKTGITWKTFGDIVSFKIQRLDGDRTQVEVSSKPVWHTALVDYGKNLENVEKIVAFLKSKQMANPQMAT